MCGITGFFSSSKKITENDLALMTSALKHRGPDAEGYYLNEEKTVGLGHRRLSIIDLSESANQPMFSHSERYVIAYNGEVYNFREIKEQLKITARTTGDTEIILEAYSKLGVDFVQLLNGMFAIAIYDKQEKKLFLVRDRLGVKPLYYYFSENNFAFASEIKSLMQSNFISQNVSVNKKVIAAFLYAGYIPSPFTIYNHILKLPAGAYAKIDATGVIIKSYWKPEEKILPETITDFQPAKEELKKLLISSVGYRMISDVPFGTFLSGGIDSSAVTAVAQSIAPQPIKTFSIGFKEAKFNESEYAKKVAQYLGTEHHEFIVTEKDALELTDKMLNVYDEPFADSSALPTMLVSKLARQHVTMTLSGDGGDELFMGYGAYNWANRLSNPWIKFLRQPIYFSLSLMGNRYKRAAQVFNYKTKEHLKSHIFSQEQYFFSEKELEIILQHDFKNEILFKENFKTNRKLSAAEAQSLFDIKYYLKDDLLVKVDIASMQYSLETRTPFLDYRIVEFALNLSENLKKQNGVSKYLLKEALYDFVPKEFFNRPKWGFSIPLAKWLKTDLNFLIKENLTEEIITKFSVINYQYVKKLLHRFELGEEYLFSRIWVLILLHRWLLQNQKREN